MMARDYWAKRAEADMDAVQESAEKLIDRLGESYRKAAQDMEQEVQKIIGTYAKRYQLTREEALERLKAPFDEDSRAYSYRISRLEALEEASQEQAQRLGEMVARALGKQRKYTANEAYRRAGEMFTERMGGIGFATPDTAGLLRAIGTSWAGKSYSQRIWNNASRLADTLRDEVTAAFLSGKSNAAIEQIIMDRFAVGFREAERLVRTETSYVANKAALQRYTDAGLEQYEFLTAKDSRTCKICAGMDGQVFLLSEAETGKNMPPMHPFCRCTVLPVVDDADADGNSALLPKDMTFNEWQAWQAAGRPKDTVAWLNGHRDGLKITTANSIMNWAKADFSTQDLAEKHFLKHESEYEAITLADYIGLARELLEMPLSEDVVMLERSDGSISKYRFSTNDFVVGTHDGKIRTVFRPIAKEDYWDEEQKRNQ